MKQNCIWNTLREFSIDQRHFPPFLFVSYFCEQTFHTFVLIEHHGLAALDDILRSRLIIHVLAVSCLGVRFSIAPQVLTA